MPSSELSTTRVNRLWTKVVNEGLGQWVLQIFHHYNNICIAVIRLPAMDTSPGLIVSNAITLKFVPLWILRHIQFGSLSGSAHSIEFAYKTSYPFEEIAFKELRADWIMLLSWNISTRAFISFNIHGHLCAWSFLLLTVQISRRQLRLYLEQIIPNAETADEHFDALVIVLDVSAVMWKRPSVNYTRAEKF